MIFVPSTGCMILKSGYTSGGKTQPGFLVPTRRDQGLQRAKALFIFQLGKQSL